MKNEMASERLPFCFIETGQTASRVYHSVRDARFLLQRLLYLRIHLRNNKKAVDLGRSSSVSHFEQEKPFKKILVI